MNKNTAVLTSTPIIRDQNSDRYNNQEFYRLPLEN